MNFAERKVVSAAADQSPAEESEPPGSLRPVRASVPEPTSTEPSLSRLVEISVMSVPELFLRVPVFSKWGLGVKPLKWMSESPLMSKVPVFFITAPLPLVMKPPLIVTSPAFSRTRLSWSPLVLVPEMVSLAAGLEPLAAEIRVLPMPLMSRPTNSPCLLRGHSLPLPPRMPPERLTVLEVEALLKVAVPPDTLSVCTLTGTEKVILPPEMVVVPSAE